MSQVGFDLSDLLLKLLSLKFRLEKALGECVLLVFAAIFYAKHVVGFVLLVQYAVDAHDLPAFFAEGFYLLCCVHLTPLYMNLKLGTKRELTLAP